MRRRLLAGALAVALGATLPACGLLPGGGDTYTLSAHFDRAVSVFKSSDVRVLGLPAGEVTKVEIQGDQVLVEMAIPTDIKVPKGAQAQIVPQSLIGERYIQLTPAYEDGMDALVDGDEVDKTVIPVEPDEALAALKEFLDSLDPEGIGALVHNLDDDLRGNGAALNDMLGSLSDLVGTFAEKDDTLLRIVDSFDKLTATLVTRESQLGEVLDAFAEASQVLADERGSIGELVSGLADLSRNGLQLVGEHSVDLRADIQTLADAAATIDANLSSVTELLSGGALLTTGIIGAFNPNLRAINLRNSFSPLVTDIVDVLIGQLGLPPVCLPLMVVGCTILGLSNGEAATPAQIDAERGATPIGALMTLLSQPGESASPGRSLVEVVGDIGHDAASTLLGVGG